MSIKQSHNLADANKVLGRVQVGKNGALLFVQYAGLSSSAAKIKAYLAIDADGPAAYLGADYDITLDAAQPAAFGIFNGFPNSYLEFRIETNGAAGNLTKITLKEEWLS